MGRTARKLSKTGIYHVMLRGNNREKVFFSDEDEMMFLKVLRQEKEKHSIRIYAYCLMPNHVHMCIEEPETGKMSKFMHGLETKFIKWYNTVHERCGHVFQGRYKSEPVENSEYLAAVIRYIHNNPVKAEMCCHPAEHPSGSYREFLAEKAWIVDRDEVFKVIARDEFEAFHFKKIDTGRLKFMEMIDKLPPQVVNEKAEEVLRTLSDCEDGMKLLGLGMDNIRRVFCECRRRGLSYRQIAEFVKKGRSTVMRIVNGTTNSVRIPVRDSVPSPGQ
ncbi:MAG: transposase [Clostridia bacterium]|nr:transposase [Clostridia bacterium]